jgi:D-lyxose ketol-isomerase
MMMVNSEELTRRRTLVYELFQRAGFVITEEEKSQIEVPGFGLDQFDQTGLGVLVYINTDRYCAKEIGMLPRQTCPEHKHPPVGDNPGKGETFRCRWGMVYLFVPGERTEHPHVTVPTGREDTYSVWREIELNPGDQYTLEPNILHWFQAGDEGAVLSEFSSTSTDENDIFTDQEIQRLE